MTGRAIVSGLFKFVPGVGSVIGGAISATTAAAVTTAFGEAYIRSLETLFKSRQGEPPLPSRSSPRSRSSSRCRVRRAQRTMRKKREPRELESIQCQLKSTQKRTAMIQATATAKPIVYPDSDGEPIAENTLQFEWIVTIKGGLDAVFLDDPNVFVAGDLLWYRSRESPKSGRPRTRWSPSGGPKGIAALTCSGRRRYRAPQVVFEVLSPGNRFGEMVRKFDFYESMVSKNTMCSIQTSSNCLAGFGRVTKLRFRFRRCTGEEPSVERAIRIDRRSASLWSRRTGIRHIR